MGSYPTGMKLKSFLISLLLLTLIGCSQPNATDLITPYGYDGEPLTGHITILLGTLPSGVSNYQHDRDQPHSRGPYLHRPLLQLLERQYLL